MASIKRCCTCKVHKNLTAFTKDKTTKDGLKARCRECRRERERDPEHKTKYNKQYWLANKDRLVPKAKAYREAHLNDAKVYQQRYREANRSRLTQYRKTMAGYMKEYNQAYKPRKNKWLKTKRCTDPLFKVSCNLRTRFHTFVKGKTKTFDALGVPIDVFRAWIEFQFEPGMSWETYSSEWELDHIIPVSRFDLTYPAQQSICFGWTNFQPKFRGDNRSKGNKIILHEFFNSLISAHRFINKAKLGRQEYQRLRESVAWLRATPSGMVTSSWMKATRPEMGNPQPSS